MLWTMLTISPVAADSSSAHTAFEHIVILESLATSAAAEQRFEQAIARRSDALQLAATLNCPRLTAVLLNRLGQTYEDNNRIQQGLVTYELGFKALAQDASLNLGAEIQ
jgi:hypothetical protein